MNLTRHNIIDYNDIVDVLNTYSPRELLLQCGDCGRIYDPDINVLNLGTMKQREDTVDLGICKMCGGVIFSRLFYYNEQDLALRYIHRFNPSVRHGIGQGSISDQIKKMDAFDMVYDMLRFR